MTYDQYNIRMRRHVLFEKYQHYTVILWKVLSLRYLSRHFLVADSPREYSGARDDH
jgi:hypothetical protein